MSHHIDEKFSGITRIGENLLISHLENNLKSFLDWGFLNIGGFINVVKPEANLYNNEPYNLAVVDDPNFDSGCVWQPMRKDWVWESGISIGGTTPVLISGVTINNSFYNLTNTTYPYIVDYTNSRIIFEESINPESLTMNFSYRWVQVYKFNDANWWQEIQYNTDANTSHFEQSSDGDFSIFSVNRVQLPTIVIETVPRGISRPYQLGNKSLIVEQDVILHILAKNRFDRNNLIDIIRLQQDKVIWLYDTNKVVNGEAYSFNFNGSLNSNRIQYDQLVKDPNYQWRTCRLKNIIVSEVESFSTTLSEAKIRLTAEIIFGDI